MSLTATDTQLRSEERRKGHTNRDAWQARINQQIAAEWLDMEKLVAWHGGYRLNALIVKKNEHGWMLMVKAHRNGRAYVAYVQSESLPEAYEFGGELASRGLLTWQHDGYPTTWLKRLLNIK